MENVRLSGWQMITMTFCFVCATTFLLLPGKLIEHAKQYGWIVCVWSFLYGVLLALLWLHLSKLYPGQSIVQIAMKGLGKWVGGIVAALYILYFIQVAAWVTRNLGDFMHTSFMPRTPISVFNIVVLLVCAYAVVKGIESIAMLSELVTPYIVIAFWAPFTVMLKVWDWRAFNNTEPFRLWDTFIQTKYALAFPYMELVMFMMIFPYVKRNIKKSFVIGIISAGVILSVCVYMTIGILGLERGANHIYPVFTIFREMKFIGFLEHLESILSVNIFLLVYIKLCLLFYCAVLAICQVFHLERRGVVAYPLIWIISAYSLLFDNVIENMEWVQKYLFDYYLLYAVIMPIALILCYWMRKWLSGGKLG
ncbi:spore germination protein KB [Paenibacillus glycanilyticus]|uniref:Spore germination protein KB n=1 Tax=Paenibacillus glycanilyticus TaxID=126569 RepID=A0ABQ6NPP6_9BACL|nr:endospore germination permease [Paenibacillus glycanilyticus]GMK47061.1 spore germination protein KB [Paenibacillus glycanilyticus]